MARPTALKWFKRSLVAVAGSAVAFTAFMGFAHTKPGRPLLALLGRTTANGKATGGGCPLGYDKNVSPAEREAGRQRSMAIVRGTERAASRPALGFALDRTTRDEVNAWASSHHVTCAEHKGAADLTCTDVPDDALPEAYRGVGVSSMYLRFDPNKRLVSLGTVRNATDAGAVAAVDKSIADDLTATAGPPARVNGEPTAAFLEQGALRQARAEFRFRDYYATTSATNMGGGKYVVSEQYQSIAD